MTRTVCLVDRALMVIDTSALLASLFDEPEAQLFEELIERDPVRLISTATMLEASMVVEARLGAAGGRELDLLLRSAAIDFVPVQREHAETARDAWRRFGKGRHIAGLNFGDCFSYALSKVAGEPLLFKGDDFPLTDIEAVVRDTDEGWACDEPVSSEIHQEVAPYDGKV